MSNHHHERFRKRMAAWDARATGPEPDPKLASAESRARRRIAESERMQRQHPSEARALQEARRRCQHPRNKDYADYGGRGITVCEQWLRKDGFLAFLEHLGPKPSPSHTLDRIDNMRGYEPGNVRWATRLTQANNRRSSRLITWRGETRTAAEWGAIVDIPRQYIVSRLENGWGVERALTTPPIRRVLSKSPANDQDHGDDP